MRACPLFFMFQIKPPSLIVYMTNWELTGNQLGLAT